MKHVIKSVVYTFIACCIAHTLSTSAYSYQAILYFSLLGFLVYEIVKSYQYKEVK